MRTNVSAALLLVLAASATAANYDLPVAFTASGPIRTATVRLTRLQGGASYSLLYSTSPQSFGKNARILLEVRETNLPAQVFFRSHGFRAVSVLRDFYEDTTEDAYLMQYRYRAEADAAPATRITRLAG